MKTGAQPVDPPNPAMTTQFHSEREWRGVGDPFRSAERKEAKE
jgi:hypothetical protein